MTMDHEHHNAGMIHAMSVLSSSAIPGLISLQHIQLHHHLLTAMHTFCMASSTQMALGILQESMAAKVAPSSSQVCDHEYLVTQYILYVGLCTCLLCLEKQHLMLYVL